MLRLRRSSVGLVFLLASACVADDAPGTENETGSDTSTETDTGSDATGEQLYAGMCAVCHGPEAEGTNIAYELRHPHDDYARWVIRNGRTSIEFQNQVMVPFTPEMLADEDLDRILEYLDSFPQPTTPEALYLDYCRNCHGIDAAGGVVDKPLMNAPIQDFIENTRQGFGGSDYGNRLIFMPARTEAELSDAEIQAIFDHVAGL